MTKPFVAILKCPFDGDYRYYVMLSDKHTICGFRTEEDGLRTFSNTYRSAHARSHEASMSAAINWLFFHPAIIACTLDELRGWMPKDPIVESISNISGSFLGCRLVDDHGKTAWDLGAKPSLV